MPSAPAPADSGLFSRRLIVGILLFAACVAALVTFALYVSRETYRDQARATAKNMALVLDRFVSGVIDKVDLVLLSVEDEVIRQTAGGRAIDGPGLNAFLAREQEHLPELESLRVADVSGTVVYGREVPAANRINVGDRQYFIRGREEPRAGLVLDGPMFARISKKWVLVLARRLTDAEGRFVGVVYVNVALDRFTGIFATLDLGAGGVISLRDRSLGLIARYPAPADPGAGMGDRNVPAAMRELVAAGETAATGLIGRGEGANERAFALRRAERGDLYVTVSLAADDYLAEWRTHALWLWGLAALLVAMAIGGVWFVQRGWRRQLAVAEQLAREEEKFHTVADYTYDWEYWQGPEGSILFMAPACQRVTGYAAAEFVADPGLIERIVHPDDQEKMTNHEHADARNDVATLDFRIVRRDGEIRWIAHGCRAVFGRDGAFLGRRVSNRDVTERRQAEERVRRAYAYTRSLIEASLDPLVTIGPDGRITDVNSATEAATGHPRQALIGTEFSDYFSEPERARAGYLQAFREGRVQDYALELRHRDGHVMPVLYNAAVYRDEAGAVVGVFAAARDVTERRRAENQVRQLNEELERRVVERTAQLETANRELEEFSYSLSHDLRTPLRAIAGFAQILVEDYGGRLDDEGRRLLAVVRDNATRMGRLMDSILHFLRLGRMPLRPAVLDLAALAGEVFTTVQAEVPDRALRLEIGALPPGWGDVVLLREVFDHLLRNAVKYTAPKGGTAVIEVDGTAGDGENVYHVRDNGIGFDMRFVDKLFRVFERVHPTGQFEGSGIGLAIVKRIIQRHGGRVWAEGRENEGATIHFTLPVRR